MAVKRNTYKFRKGKIIEVEEFHDGNYGAKGKKRAKKEKLTSEQQKEVNAKNKAKRCRHRMLEYINPNDLFITWTYEIENRPVDMDEAKKHFQKAIRKLKNKYDKRGSPLYFFKNIERGSKGGWHIHLVINRIENAESYATQVWEHGGTYTCTIKNNKKLYDEDFTRLANYMTKDENTVEINKDGSIAKPKIKESSYSTSRNMPLPEPKVDKLIRWKPEPKTRKGYRIIRIYEGINQLTGFTYRRYTMVRD